MKANVGRVAVVLHWAGIVAALAAAPEERGRAEPILRVQASGPTSYVTGLSFAPDSRTLYAGGWDKVVHVWSWDERSSQFVPDERASYRVPIGPGLEGAINALALSEDGRWLAVAGRGVMRSVAGFAEPGLIVPSAGTVSEDMRLDEGVIHVFDTQTRQVRSLRGHAGPVLAMEFAPVRAGKPPLLVSAAQEWDAQTNQPSPGIRLWNLEDRTQVAGFLGIAGNPKVRPGLAVWHTGAQVEALRVAIVWGTNRLLLWDVAGQRFEPVPDAPLNFTAARTPDGSRLLTGGWEQLQLWELREAERVGLAFGPKLPLPPSSLVGAIAIFDSKAGGAGGRWAAAVLLGKTANEPLRLVLVDLEGKSPLRGPYPLWGGGAAQPSLAAAPNGEFLAVAGNREHDVLVYRTADLLAGKAQPQKLRSIGRSLAHAVFVQRVGPDGRQVGLLLREDGAGMPPQAPQAPSNRPRPGDLVLDLSSGRLSDAIEGWTPDVIETGGWRLESSEEAGAEGGRSGLVLRAPGGEETRIVLEPNQKLRVAALAPPRAELPIPVVAVASERAGQPSLDLFHGGTGQPLRKLTGHFERIGSLVFTGDGRLLVSTAGDQTACVWSLVDIRDRLLGRRGRVVGMAVTQQGGRLVVGRVDEDGGIPPDVLSEGDEIEGIVAEGVVQATANPTEFHNAISLKTPGGTITVRVRRQGAQRDVVLPIGQAIDERKPLFSLFLPRTRGEERSWIGWTPIGPYEASDRAVEQHLGWHFETGDPAAPVAFALADKYREIYYRHGLLGQLVEHGEFRPPAPPPRLMRPKATVSLEERGRVAPVVLDGAEALVRSPRSTLRLALYGEAADHIASARWRAAPAGDARKGEEITGDCSLGEYREWSADLLPVFRRSGRYQIRIELVTDEAEPQRFWEELAIRYQPPPPKVTASWTGERQAVRAPGFGFSAKVQPGEEGVGPIAITLRHRDREDRIQERTWERDGAAEIAEKLDLTPGDNVLELLARNKNALPGHEESETARVGLVVTYDPVVTDPPRIVLASVRTPSGTPMAVSPSSAPLVVRQPALLVEGKIEAAEPLAKADWRVVGGPAARSLAGFRPDTAKELPIREQIELTRGLQTLRFVAKTAASVEVHADLPILYQPPLPDIVLASPHDGQTVLGTEGIARISVRGVLGPAAHEAPFRAEVLVDGRSVPGVVIDPAARTVAGEVPLSPGEHRIVVQLSNEWGAQQAASPVVVIYRRPPRVVRIDKKDQGDLPFLDLVAIVETPADLPLTEASVAGRRVSQPQAKLVSRTDSLATWEVVVPDVPLEQGDNAIPFRVANADGWSPGEQVLKVAYAPPPPPKAQIELIHPQRDVAVTEPGFPVEFLVRSSTPLKSVELTDGRTVFFQSSEAGTQVGEMHELRGRPVVALKEGANSLVVRAVNAGGAQTASVAISFVATPVRLVVERIESIEASGKEPAVLVPRREKDHRIVFPRPAPGGKVRIRGHVSWLDPKDPAITRPAWLRIWVNGFQQIPVPLRDRAGDQPVRSFEAPIVLNRPEGNRITFELPGLQEDEASREQFTLDCAQPIRGQTLHLLVVGPGESNQTKLAERALRALRSDPGRSPADPDDIARVRVYGPLVDFVSPQKVLFQLERIRTSLLLARNSDSPLGVVMVFYQGEESAESQGRFFLLTSDSIYDPNLDRSAIASSELTRFFSRTPGAHLLLLDVVRRDAALGQRGASDYGEWPAESHVAVFRYAWRKAEDATQGIRLVGAFERAIDQSPLLKEIESEFSKSFAFVAQQYPGALRYEPRIPEDLFELTLTPQ